MRDLLVERFADSPLAYHNFRHIAAMLDGLATYFPGLSERDRRILRYGIWFHDLIYDVRIFPNSAACLRLVRALTVETHENWLEAPRYLNMDELKEQKKIHLRQAA